MQFDQMSREELIAALERKNSLSGGIKVSAKGAVSLYGLGKWPVTLYATQWDKLEAKMPEIRAFIEANRDKLAVKGE